MTHHQAWSMTWGLDTVGYLAFADWLNEHPNVIDDEPAPLWRFRAKIAQPLLAWIAGFNALPPGFEKIDPEDVPPSWRALNRITLTDDCWLVPALHPKTIRFEVWRERPITRGMKAKIGGTSFTIERAAYETTEPPAIVFPRDKLALADAGCQRYLRRRIFGLADRLRGPS